MNFRLLSAFLLSLLIAPAPARADDAAAGQAAALGQAKQQSASSNAHPDAQWFPDAGLGLFIHWGVASPRGSGDLSWAMLANKPWRDTTVTPNTYYATINDWKPDRVDYDALLAAAKAAGFGYAVMVTKHHDGLVTREVAMIPWNGELRSPGHDKTVEPDFFLPMKPDILDSKLVYGPKVKEKIRLAMREMEASRYKDMYYPDVTFLEPNPVYRAQRVLVALRRGDTPLDCAQRWAAYREHMKDVPENPAVEPTGIE